MEFATNLFVSGLTIGMVYGLVALGFVLIYKATGILNVAQGEILMFGAFICYCLSVQLNLPFWLAIPLTLVFAFFLGFLIERVFLRPMIGQSLLAVVMMTIGLISIFKGVVLVIWGPVSLSYPPYLPKEPIHIGALAIAQVNFWGFIIAIFWLFVCMSFFRYTKIGTAMRAVADDQQAAQSVGVSIKRVFGMSWAISCSTAAMGGIILATMLSVIYTIADVGLASISAVLVGGLESLGGSILGGLIIGVIQSFCEGYLGESISGIGEIAPYVILLLILLIKPYGLFGLKRIERI